MKKYKDNRFYGYFYKVDEDYIFERGYNLINYVKFYGIEEIKEIIQENDELYTRLLKLKDENEMLKEFSKKELIELEEAFGLDQFKWNLNF